MAITTAILNYRRFLKRRNYSPHTIKNYLNTLKHFLIWVDVPIEQMTHRKTPFYVDHLLDKGLKPGSINRHLNSIRQFYEYLRYEEELKIENPVREGDSLRMPKPLPRHIRDEHVNTFLKVVKGPRDQAIFMLMLRSGLRVSEVTNLTLDSIDFRRGKILVQQGKGTKDRISYISEDAMKALVSYIKVRERSRTRKVFLVTKGSYKGQPLSVRGVQKRMEYYARKAGLPISCHHLRHTMATEMLNAGSELATIQDLLGHANIKTTQRYCKISNIRVQQDYHKAMEIVMERTGPLMKTD